MSSLVTWLSRLTTTFANAPAPIGFAVTATAYGAITAPAPVTTLGVMADVGADLAGKSLAAPFALAKLTYDGLSFGYAYYQCGK